MLSSNIDRVSKIAESLDSVYEDDVQFLLLSSNHSSLMEKYTTVAVPMTVDELARSILSNASFFNASNQTYACMMPSKDGIMMPVIAERFNHFELVHQNAAEEDSEIESRNQPEFFYQGREQLSWYGARQGFTVTRNEMVQKLKKSIADMNNSYGVFHVSHDPGIGGSTFARDFAYHKKYMTPANINNPVVALEWANLELLCNECHQKEHQKTRNTAETLKFGLNGDLIAPRVSILTRHAKTTYPTFVYLDFPFSMKNEVPP